VCARVYVSRMYLCSIIVLVTHLGLLLSPFLLLYLCVCVRVCVCRFLAATYAAEALCLLGRYKEATVYLRPNAVLGQNTAESSARPARPGMWLPTSPATISALHVNLATVHTLAGDYDQAGRCVTTALQHCPHFQPAVQLQVYLFLHSGRSLSLLSSVWLSVSA
jgi:hypothetical protein